MAAEGYHIPAKESAAVCAPCRQVQSKVMCACPQGWVLSLTLQEDQGMCQADTCTGGTGELEKGELCSTNADWNLHYTFAAAEMLEKL